jgi:hypothetical protein
MKDFIKDADGDLLIKDNDLFIGNSDQQHQEDLLITEKGAIKQFLGTGVGIGKFLESEDPAGLLREINIQFTADGMKVNEIKITSEGKLSISADY